MGSPAPIQYGKEIQKRANEYHYKLPADYFDLISWVEKYDLSLHPEKLAGRPLYFWHGEKDEKIPFTHTKEFVDENRDTAFGEKIVFRSSITERHMVKVPLMEEAADFLAKMMDKIE